jgi:hypothetical protein
MNGRSLTYAVIVEITEIVGMYSIKKHGKKYETKKYFNVHFKTQLATGKAKCNLMQYEQKGNSVSIQMLFGAQWGQIIYEFVFLPFLLCFF